MANQNALHDDNKWPALTAHTGTAGTAETRRVVVDTDGNLMVNIAAGESINIGTLSLGTINTIGTISKVESGSISVVAGTVNTGTIDLLKAGTITRVEQGSITVTAGTITSGSIVVTAGTIATGSIAVTAGTVYGTITNIDETYDIRIDESASGTIYYGFAAPGQGTNTSGTVWQIMQKVYDATTSTYLYADGDKNFNNSWANRASLTYS